VVLQAPPEQIIESAGKSHTTRILKDFLRQRAQIARRSGKTAGTPAARPT